MIKELGQAVRWFQNAVRDALNGLRSPVTDLRGQLVLLVYDDPKGKEKLPYYDTAPLVFVLHTGPGYILGLNVHYLHPFQRKIMVEALMAYTEKTEEHLKLKFEYMDIANFVRSKHAKVCLKRYDTKRVANWMMISPLDWGNVLYLPIYDFKKASVVQVWKESREKL